MHEARGRTQILREVSPLALDRISGQVLPQFPVSGRARVQSSVFMLRRKNVE